MILLCDCQSRQVEEEQQKCRNMSNEQTSDSRSSSLALSLALALCKHFFSPFFGVEWRYLKSADDEQRVDVVEGHLLGDLLQMFPGKCSASESGAKFHLTTSQHAK